MHGLARLKTEDSASKTIGPLGGIGGSERSWAKEGQVGEVEAAPVSPMATKITASSG